MQINVFLAEMFRKIADKLNKQEKNKSVEETDYMEVNNISITSIIAGRLATLVTSDSSATISGDSRAIEVLKPFLDSFYDKDLKKSMSASFGTGDLIAIPITNKDGQLYDVNVISNGDFQIYEEFGNHIYSIGIKRESFEDNRDTYTWSETHSIEKDEQGINVWVIRRYAFKGVGAEKEISWESVERWKDIPQIQTFPNVDYLPFGRFKCPTVNRNNLNAKQGVPITYGQDYLVDQVKKSITRFYRECENKETILFAGKQMFTLDRNGNPVLNKQGVFYLVNTDLDTEQLPVKEFSPDLRINEMIDGINEGFKLLEMACELSAGVMTPVESSMATATEIRASQNPLFAFESVVWKVIESGINDLLKGIEILYNSNNTVALGKYEVSYEWDYSMRESSTETFQQYLQAYGIGEIKKGEIRSWIKGIPIDQAVEELEEVEEVAI
jgi:A118 family predicted phage portal protein